MKKLAMIPTLVLASAAIGASALAQMHPHHRGQSHMAFEDVDADADGNVTLEEIQTAQAKRFDSADADGNGTISLEEFKAAAEARRVERWEKRQENRFGKIDTNGDGLISREEHDAHRQDHMTRMFERIDSNDDGVISEAERAAVMATRMEHRGRRGSDAE